MSKKFELLLIVGLLATISACKTTEKTAEAEMDKGPQLPMYITDTISGSGVPFDLAFIPGGTYTMGSALTDAQREEDEGPGVTVTVEPFWMGKYELTFDEYNVYREIELDLAPPGRDDWDADAMARPSPPYEDPTFGMGKETFPAASMTQFAALQYCKWLSDKTGEFYRLPTEAEWEYACRAGSTTTYYYGDDATMLAEYAWYDDNSSEKYHPCGSKLPNKWGLYDMLGNVSEWTLDQYTKDAYVVLAEQVASGAVGDFGISTPWIQPTRLHPRTVRGGSWDDSASEHRSGARLSSSPRWKMRDPQIPKSFWWNTDSPFVGFRIVKPHNQPSKEVQENFWLRVLGDG